MVKEVHLEVMEKGEDGVDYREHNRVMSSVIIKSTVQKYEAL